MTICGID
jgi:hypothetical protein